MHLVIHSKKERIWHKRFGHLSNAQIICTSKLLAGIGEFNIIYNLIKIYSNSKASKPKDANIKTKPKASLQVSKITNFGLNFDKICKPCIKNK